MEFLVEEWCRIPPVESMPRRIDAVLACGGPSPITKLYVGVSLIWQLSVVTKDSMALIVRVGVLTPVSWLNSQSGPHIIMAN
jgi:hypothetical protein